MTFSDESLFSANRVSEQLLTPNIQLGKKNNPQKNNQQKNSRKTIREKGLLMKYKCDIIIHY